MSNLIERRNRIREAVPHLASASGSIASFQTDMMANLEEIKIHFNPQQASGTPSPTNVLPISGWTGLTLNQSGKNMFDINTLEVPGTITVVNGVATGTTRNFRKYFGVEGKMFEWGKNERFYLSAKAYRDNPQADVYRGLTFSGRLSKSGSFTMAGFPNDTGVPTVLGSASYNSDITEDILLVYGSQPDATWHTSEIQIELGTQQTEFEPFIGNQIPVSWSSTYYGGWANPLTGEGMMTYKKYVCDGSSDEGWFNNGDAGQFHRYQRRYMSDIVAGRDGRPGVLCDMFVPTTSGVNNSVNMAYYSAGEMTIKTTDWATLNDFKAYIAEHPFEVVGELREPIPFSFTPISPVKSLVGTNNIWSSANGNVDVKYWKH